MTMLSKPCVWSLKSKKGKDITPEQMSKIAKLNRKDLFPPKFSIDEIEVLEYINGIPKEKRWMNPYMVFRRVLGLSYKEVHVVFNGTELSQHASLIWDGADSNERQVYIDISKQLKARTYRKNPNYVFRKIPKPSEEYINYSPESFVKNEKRKRNDEDEDDQRIKKRTCNKNTIAEANEFNNKLDDKQDKQEILQLTTITSDSNEIWYPQEGQDFLTYGGPYPYNEDSSLPADETLWSQSFAPRVDPGMNMPLIAYVSSDEILGFRQLHNLWPQDESNFHLNYDQIPDHYENDQIPDHYENDQIPCDNSDSIDNSCYYRVYY